MMICEAITSTGAISADWTLVGAFCTIGVLLTAIAGILGRHFITSIDKITSRLDHHDNRLTDLERVNIKHDAELEAIRKVKDSELGLILAKLEALK